MNGRQRHNVQIPVSATKDHTDDVTIYLPAEMTEGEWAQMQAVLAAMKPVLVRDVTGVNIQNGPINHEQLADRISREFGGA